MLGNKKDFLGYNAKDSSNTDELNEHFTMSIQTSLHMIDHMVGGIARTATIINQEKPFKELLKHMVDKTFEWHEKAHKKMMEDK